MKKKLKSRRELENENIERVVKEIGELTKRFGEAEVHYAARRYAERKTSEARLNKEIYRKEKELAELKAKGGKP